MNFNFSRILMIFLAVAVCLAFVACSDDDDDNPTGSGGVSAPTLSVAIHTGGAPGSEFIILFQKVRGIDSYKLYESDDGVDYDVVSGASFSFMGDFGFVFVTSMTDKYYYVTASSGNDESDHGPIIFAEPNNYSPGGDFINTPADGAIGVSQAPTIDFDPVTDAVMYAVAVYQLGVTDIWNILLGNGTTSVMYGATGPNIITANEATPLTPDTEYGVVVEAINANNWGFARDDNTFRTDD